MEKLCECGCGQIIKPENKFIKGHNNRNKNLSEEWNRIKDIIKYCKCGCGQEIVIKFHHRRYGVPDYIQRHYEKKSNKKYFERWNKIKDTIKYCKCGCKQEIIIKPFHKYYGIPDYIHGHQNKEREFTKEHKKKLKDNHKGMLDKKHSKETIKKQSISALKYIEENNFTKKWARTGKIEPIFEETVLKKISGLKYEKQKPINKIGIADFFLTDYDIIIECDERYHNKPKQKEKDMNRDFLAGFIFKYQYQTIRFTDTEITNEPKKCIKELKKFIKRKKYEYKKNT